MSTENMMRNTFTTPYEQHKDREGQTFTVVHRITEAGPKFDAEVLPLYLIRFPDGAETEAWPEEVEQ